VDLLTKMLHVTPAEAAGWLSKAARKRTLAAGKQLQNGAAQTAAISAAEARQLLDVLSGIIGMQPADMAAMLRKWPRYLACEPTQPRSAVCFLREELGLTASQAAVFVRTWPQVLSMDVAVLRQRLDIWQRSLSLRDAQLSKVIGGQPRLMSYAVTSIEEQAAAVLAWCRARGGTAGDLAKMVSTQPTMLARDCSALQTNFDGFMSMCGLSQEQAAAICRTSPNVLVTNMATPGNERKLDFLQHVIGRPTVALAQNSAYLGRSLENVIAPRTYFMRARGRELSPSLHQMQLTWPRFYRTCGCTEAQYEEWLAAWRQTPEGRQWGSKVAEAAKVPRWQ